jgi:hypothetical protein
MPRRQHHRPAFAGRHLMEGRIVAGHPDLRQAVQRPRCNVRLGQKEVFALVTKGVAAEGELQHLHELEQLGYGVCERFSEALELIGLVATAHTQHQPPMAQRVHHADFRDQPHRFIERCHHHGRAELDALGLPGQPRQHHQGRRTHAIVGKVVLGKPGDLEAVGLGCLDLFDGVVIKLVGLAARCAVAHQVELAKVHRRPHLRARAARADARSKARARRLSNCKLRPVSTAAAANWRRLGTHGGLHVAAMQTARANSAMALANGRCGAIPRFGPPTHKGLPRQGCKSSLHRVPVRVGAPWHRGWRSGWRRDQAPFGCGTPPSGRSARTSPGAQCGPSALMADRTANSKAAVRTPPMIIILIFLVLSGSSSP